MKKKLWTLGILATLSAAAIYVINKLTFYISTIDNLLHKNGENEYNWRFGKIHYVKKGTGKPLLLLHDLSPVSSSCEWDNVLPLLSKNHTVYTVDLLGCGSSEKPNLTYTNFLYVQMISDFIKNIVGEPCDIIASGNSAPLALTACTGEREMIDKMIFVNPQNLHDLAKVPTKRSKLLYHFINLPLIGTLLYNILFAKKRIESLFETEYYYDPALIEDITVNTFYEAAHTEYMRSRHLFASMKGNYVNVNLASFLPSITNSVFIIHGGGNPMYEADAKLYQRFLPSIEIISISQTKRLPQMEAPNVFAEQVEILLDPK